jgi:hypothetical protein
MLLEETDWTGKTLGNYGLDLAGSFDPLQRRIELHRHHAVARLPGGAAADLAGRRGWLHSSRGLLEGHPTPRPNPCVLFETEERSPAANLDADAHQPFQGSPWRHHLHFDSEDNGVAFMKAPFLAAPGLFRHPFISLC